MIIPIPDCGKGVNMDLQPSELELGVWSYCNNYRFRNGFAEKWDGIRNAFTPTVVPYWLAPYATTTTRYAFYSGLTRAFAYGSAENEITRYTEGVAIASSTNVTTTATVNTSTNHGRTTGDTISRWGAVPDAYNGTFVITVVDPDTYTYVMATDPGGAATTMGLYSYNGAASNFTGAVTDRLTGGTLNGILIVNYPTDGLYYWAGDTAVRLRKFPATNKSDVARPFKNYIVQLASTVSGTKKPHNVAWSAAAEPGAIPSTFTAAATNDAGDVDLAETPGTMVDCLPLGDVNIIYKQDARYAMQYVGGEAVFRFQKLPGSDGLLARGCVVDTPVGHVYFTPDHDIRVHNGGESKSLAKGRIKEWINTNIIITQRLFSFLCVNEAKSEVWICFHTDGAVNAVSRMVVWNWDDDTFGIFQTVSQSMTYAASGLWPTSITTALTDRVCLLVANVQPRIGYTPGDPTTSHGYFGTPISGLLERKGLHLGSPDQVKTIQRSRWHFNAAQPVDIYHGAQKLSEGTVTYATAVSYIVGTSEFANARGPSGRYLVIKVFDTVTNFACTLRSIELDVTTSGTR